MLFVCVMFVYVYMYVCVCLCMRMQYTQPLCNVPGNNRYGYPGWIFYHLRLGVSYTDCYCSDVLFASNGASSYVRDHRDKEINII